METLLGDRVRRLGLAALVTICVTAAGWLSNSVTAQSGAVAVATFESLGLYWRPSQAAAQRAATVRYRPSGKSEWAEGLPLWFDPRDGEYRGSLVHLRPGTEYEIELTLQGAQTVETLRASTWSEQFPIAETVYLPRTTNGEFTIRRRGSPNGYILYTHQPGSDAVIDGRNRDRTNVVVTDSSYIILRGLKLRNAVYSGIRLEGDTHDIVIEGNDISNWGTATSEGWAEDGVAIFSSWEDPEIERIIVQRNKIHDPRYDANAWTQSRRDVAFVPGDGWHPIGQTAISFFDSKGNHVIRYNEIYSDEDHMFDDNIGAGTNFSAVGFPHRDSDIYGNYVAHCWDDAIESEGANMNVRIWGNYTDYVMTHYAARVTHRGPLYLWRNVAASSRFSPSGSWDNARSLFFKAGVVESRGRVWGGGAEYVFHNTVLQPRLSGLRYPIGVGEGILGSMVNQVTRNNILDAYRPDSFSIRDTEYEKAPGTERANSFDYDLYTAQLRSLSELETNGVEARPIYSPSPEFDAASRSGVFTLAPNSPGYDRAIRIPNFNDVFHGEAPDVGAHEAGMPPMQFGVGAYLYEQPPYRVPRERVSYPRERRGRQR